MFTIAHQYVSRPIGMHKSGFLDWTKSKRVYRAMLLHNYIFLNFKSPQSIEIP
jgi:hypothetical protein